MKAPKKSRKRSGRADLSCRKATALISDYVNGRLDPLLQDAFDRHVSICPDCIAFLNTYKKALQLAKSFLDQDPRPMGLGKIKTSLEAKLKKAAVR